MRGVTVMDGVYPPSEDSYLLIDAVAPLTSPGTVLELCCGTGVVGLSLANKARHIVAIDLNPVAVRNTIVNYRNSSLLEKLDAVVGDLFAPLRERTFDLVIMNPPYIEDDGKANDLSWSGGEKGRQVIDRFLDAVGALLKPGGWAVFIQSDLNGIQETVKRARSNGMKARVIREKVFRFETLLAMEVRLQ